MLIVNIMRTQARLIRVKDLSASPLEADLINFFSQNQEEIEAIAPIHIDIPKTAIPQEGERLVLSWEDGDQWLNGQAIVHTIEREIQKEDQEWQTLKLVLKLQGIENNSRHYPRMLGGVHLAFTQVDQLEEVEGWVDHTIDLNLNLTPLDPLMNFSVNGLKFEANLTLNESTLLACEVGLKSNQERWRTLAKVVRVWDEGDHFSIAVHFISPPTGLTEAFSEYTLRLQKAEM
jgi:hypothetical protein